MVLNILNFFTNLPIFSVLAVLIVFFAIILLIILFKLFSHKNNIFVTLCIFSFIITVSGIVSLLYFNNTVYAKSIISMTSEMINFNNDVKPGEAETLSFHLAYSDRISEPTYIDGELGFYMDATNWFYWADGKLLPESKMKEKDRFSEFRFSLYPEELPSILEKNDTNYKNIQTVYGSRRLNVRDNTFLDMLYGASTRVSMDLNMSKMSALGRKTEGHSMVVEKLKIVDKEVTELASTNANVKDFLDSLQMVSGYLWRNISKSSNRSYHSYGVAFDLLPKTTRGKQVYWDWSRVHYKHWYSIPYSKRWMPPDELIKIFERHGFVWGGKWQFFDTMHFEYRPEIIIYNRLINDEVLLKKLIKLI